MAHITALRTNIFSPHLSEPDAILLMGRYCERRQFDLNQANHYVAKEKKVREKKEAKTKGVKLTEAQKSMLRAMGLC